MIFWSVTNNEILNIYASYFCKDLSILGTVPEWLIVILSIPAAMKAQKEISKVRERSEAQLLPIIKIHCELEKYEHTYSRSLLLHISNVGKTNAKFVTVIVSETNSKKKDKIISLKLRKKIVIGEVSVDSNFEIPIGQFSINRNENVAITESEFDNEYIELAVRLTYQSEFSKEIRSLKNMFKIRILHSKDGTMPNLIFLN